MTHVKPDVSDRLQFGMYGRWDKELKETEGDKVKFICVTCAEG